MTGSRRVKAGIVGCGDISLHGYFPHVSKTFDLVATCDLIEDRAREMARIWGAQAYYTDVDEMLAKGDVEAIFVLTNMSSHAPVSLKAVQAGKHFLVQKPFATDFDEGMAVVKTARQVGVKGIVEPNYWLDPVHMKAKEIIEEGHIGTVHYIQGNTAYTGAPKWGGETFYERDGGGMLFDMGVYVISALAYLLGPAEKIVGMAAVSIPERAPRYSDDVFTDFLRGYHAGDDPFAYRVPEGTVPAVMGAYDNTFTLIQWPGECLACIVANSVSVVMPPPSPRLILCGDKGTLAFGVPGSGSRLSVSTLDKESPYYVGAPRGGRGVGWYNFPGNYFQSWNYMRGSVEHLHDCILTDAEPIASIEWGMHVAEIMIKCFQSSEQGRSLDLVTTF